MFSKVEIFGNGNVDKCAIFVVYKWTSPKFTRFTRLHISTWQVATVALVPLCRCVGTAEERKDFSPFFSQSFLSPPLLSFHLRSDDIALCVRVCLASAVCSTGGLEGGVKREEC